MYLGRVIKDITLKDIGISGSSALWALQNIEK